MKNRSFEKSLALQNRFHEVIPGGAHTYAKGDDQSPEFCPPYLVRGSGCHVWDVDGNEYIEYGMGLRAVSLGHAYGPVCEAAYKQMLLGNNYSRPAVIELKAAEAFLSIVENAEMVKFAKNGSDATTAAIKLARAYTGRKIVAQCSSHPFFSTDDWFIGTTAMNRGISSEIQNLVVSFTFNDIESVRDLFHKYPGQIACFIMEGEKYDPIDPAFLSTLQALCKQNGSLFILDEMITGFRWHLGGFQTKHQITPDLSTFGKAMGNGFAVSALAGKKEIMELGGLLTDKERVFLLSTTHGAEHHALAAFMAVIQEYRKHDVIQYLNDQGERLRSGLLQAIKANNLEGYVGVEGFPSCMVYTTKDQNKKPSQPFRTLLLQELSQRGILAPNIVISFSHTDKIVDQSIAIFNEAFQVYRKALDEGVDKYLVGRPVQPVFRKWNHQHHNEYK